MPRSSELFEAAPEPGQVLYIIRSPRLVPAAGKRLLHAAALDKAVEADPLEHLIENLPSQDDLSALTLS